MARVYMSRCLKGNLLDLWAHLETIPPHPRDWESIQQKATSQVYLDAETLALYFHKWIDRSFDCATTECSYCYVCQAIMNILTRHEIEHPHNEETK
jgi:hypothetical protein